MSNSYLKADFWLDEIVSFSLLIDLVVLTLYTIHFFVNIL